MARYLIMHACAFRNTDGTVKTFPQHPKPGKIVTDHYGRRYIVHTTGQLVRV